MQHRAPNVHFVSYGAAIVHGHTHTLCIDTRAQLSKHEGQQTTPTGTSDGFASRSALVRTGPVNAAGL